jgi:type IV pilus assembly protein PilA
MEMNEKGYTLIELLAVVVILAIISSIAVVSIGNLIEQSKQKAFVSQALHLKEAANLFVTNLRVDNPEAIPNEVTYKKLYDEGFIEKIKDPFTDQYLSPGTNKTTVTLQQGAIKTVCLYGEEKKLCPESLADLNESNIVNK